MKRFYNSFTLCAVMAMVFCGHAQEKPSLDRKILTESLSLGRTYFLSNQLKPGNFRYEYDLRNGDKGGSDNSVRQAGALWGASLIHAEMPSEKTDKLLRRGFRFFAKSTLTLDSGAKLVIYPGEREGRTGTIALLSLALVEYLRTEPKLPETELKAYRESLDGYLKFLLSIRTRDGSFSSSFNKAGKGVAEPSPYFDGETLLLLSKAAKYMGREDLKAIIMSSAEHMYRTHVLKALREDPDSAQCKGFYQWGTMSFYEIYTSGWGEETKVYGGRILKLAEWMIKTHRVLNKSRNTAYAYEGLIHAYDIARRERNRAAMTAIRDAVDKGLLKLCTWQVGSSIANPYIKGQSKVLDRAKGGVLNSAKEPTLRIDVTQHQMHAVILARRYIYKDRIK